MKHDFEEHFSSYPTRELLKILQQPDDYRPEAIAAIQKILSGRPVAQEEEEAVHTELLQDLFSHHYKKEKLEQKWSLFFKIQHFVRNPALIRQDEYLVLFLQVVLGIYYLIFLKRRLMGVYYAAMAIEQVSLFMISLLLIQLCSTPVIIFLLHQKNRNAWLFSSLGKWIELVYVVIVAINLYPYMSFLPGRYKLELGLHFLLIAGILVILNYKQTKKILHITVATQLKIIGISLILGLLYYWLLTEVY